MRRFAPTAALFHSVALAVLAAGVTDVACETYTFEKDIRPIVQQYCVSCHGAEKQKGDLNLERFETEAMVSEAIAIWQRSAKRVQELEMPPDNAPLPTLLERAKLVEWSKGLKPPEGDCNQIASEESVSWYPGIVMGRRLTRTEYENTVRDLFGVTIPVAHIFPADGAGGEGFDTSGNALFISAIQAEKYLQVADLVIETALPEKLPRQGENSEQLKANRARFIGEEPKRGADPRTVAEAALRAFLPRAWRGPVDDASVERLLGVFDKARADRRDYAEALKLAMKAALVSPNFIFLAEPQPTQAGTYALGDYQVASRLSYFLWSSMPDDVLFAAAAAGQLREPEQIRAQVERMLLDPKSRALGEVFAAQWLGTTMLGVTTKPDQGRFPEFDTGLNAAMRDELALYFHRIVSENRSLLELIESDYTYVNRALASIYGIEGVTGDGMQLVTLADPNRSGVTGMAAVLTATSHPLRTSPVLRGKWVLEQLLGERVPPPPPNVPQLPEDEQHLGGKTLREQLEIHRANPECASCHEKMDQIGFGLENFDPIGRWRTDQAGQPIDSKGVLPSGEAFSGPKELRGLLLARKDQFVQNLARKMVGYALGRDVGRFDACVVEDCVKALQGGEYRAAALFQTIALSHPFRHRYSAGAATGGA